ncbi:MAG: C1 family peptidase, partial [Thermoguttaceae bacterium]
IVAAKVSADKNNVYFYVKTAEPITGIGEPNWMMLFLNTDKNYTTGWLGYDFVVNRNAVHFSGDTKPQLEQLETVTIEKHVDKNGITSESKESYAWDSPLEISAKAKGNEIEIAIPFAIFGDALPEQIDFKWADNIQQTGEWSDFTINGDVAPNDRYNFRAIFDAADFVKNVGSAVSTEETLPASADLTPLFEKYGLTLRDQGTRETCSVFTIVGAVEFAVGKIQGKTEHLSVDYANWAKNQHARRPGDGGFFNDTWRGVRNLGICPEKDLPYSSEYDANLNPSEECVAKGKKLIEENKLELNWIKRWNPKTGLTENEFTEIKRAIHNGSPVCVGLRWSHSRVIENGVMLAVPAEKVYDGHSILFVGYKDTENESGEGMDDSTGGGYFIFRNTNNPNHEEKMSYEYAKEFANDAVFITTPTP